MESPNQMLNCDIRSGMPIGQVAGKPFGAATGSLGACYCQVLRAPVVRALARDADGVKLRAAVQASIQSVDGSVPEALRRDYTQHDRHA